MAMRGGWRVAARRWREVTAATGVARQNRVPQCRGHARVCSREYSKQARPLVLGIESTFDDTGVCILDSTGHVLGESLLSQREHHVKTGGTVPLVARELHEQNLPIAVADALQQAELPDVGCVDVLALAVGPGLGPCLRAGLTFTQRLSADHNLPVLPVHHMEAHALMPRMDSNIEFPYLVLLASGGHCMLLLAEGVQRFRRLGNLLDDSPGDAFEKVARAMDLTGGGPQVEQLAAQGDEHRFELCHPLRHARSCDFSFSGLRTMAERAVAQHRRDDNSLPLQDARDIAASFQRAALHHIMVQSHRALLYCRSIDKMPTSMVVSGGVACNAYLRDKVAWLCEWHGVQPAFPSPALCTDNGRMIAWTGLEYLRAGVEPEQDISQWRFKTRWPLGVDESASVQAADIPVKRLYAQLASSPQQDTTTASS